MTKSKPRLTIGIPVRNEEENIPNLILEVEDLILSLEKYGIIVEILVNENASDDESAELLRRWAKANSKVNVVYLKFLISYQESILSLMKNSQGDAFVVLQSDLQDPPMLILEFARLWLEGNQVVAGKISNRQENFFEKKFRFFFYKLLNIVSDGNFISGLQDFYLVSDSVLKNLTKLPSIGLFLRGHITNSYGPIHMIEYERRKRLSGKTKFKFADKYSLALDGILLFGTRFIRIISVASFLLFAFSVFAFTLIIILHLIGMNYQAKRWLSIALVLLIILAILGIGISLILEYLIRLYRLLILGNNR
jgi:dolichol-phosphate mannosyltransferase